jgi:Response regulator containing a CheY-like receiver domain and an HTH DNA-binding domain
MDKGIRVGVADDHPALRAGVKALLAAREDFRFAGEADTAAAAEGIEADVLLVDLSMPGDVFGAIARTVAAGRTRVVVFTAFCSADSAIRAMEAGASGFVLKGSPASGLLEAIEAVAAGETYVAREYAGAVMQAIKARGRDKARPEEALTARERQIAAHLTRGLTNREIADELGVSEKTVKHYMGAIMAKLEVRSRLEAVVQLQGREPSAPDAFPAGPR